MKKIWRSLFFIGFIFVAGMRICLAWGPVEQHDMGVLENHLFNQVYEQDAPDVRLNRVEETVFGTRKDKLSPEQRLAQLRHAVPLTVRPTASAPQSTSNSTPPVARRSPQKTSSPAKSVAESDYPIMDEMEKRVLGQSYIKDDLTERLPRLEGKVFGSPQTGDLMSRVDRLHDVVLGGGSNPPNDGDNNATAVGGGSDPNEPSAYTPSGGGSDPTIPPEQVEPAVGKIEQQLFHKKYAQDPIDSRLSRIETKLFNSPSPAGLSPQERLGRIVSVATAGGENPTSTRSPNATLAIQLLPVVLMLLPLFI